MSAQSREERFEAALEECCQRVQNGESLEHCLAGYPADYAEELRKLVPLVTPLSRLGRDPSPEFAARLEQDLLTRMTAAEPASPLPTRPRARGWLAGPLTRLATVAAVVVVLFVGGGWGAVQASADSLPDSPLYNIKLASESAEETFAWNDDAKINIHLRHMQRRGDELERALAKGKGPVLVDGLALRLAAQAKQATDDALTLRANGQTTEVATTRQAIMDRRQAIAALTSQARPAVRPALQRLLAFLDQQINRLD
jgi:hypothetical protein